MVFGITVIATSKKQESLRRKGNRSLPVPSSVAGLLWAPGSQACDMPLTTPQSGVMLPAFSFLPLDVVPLKNASHAQWPGNGGLYSYCTWWQQRTRVLHILSWNSQNFLQGAKKLEGNQATAQIVWTF